MDYYLVFLRLYFADNRLPFHRMDHTYVALEKSCPPKVHRALTMVLISCGKIIFRINFNGQQSYLCNRQHQASSSDSSGSSAVVPSGIFPLINCAAVKTLCIPAP